MCVLNVQVVKEVKGTVEDYTQRGHFSGDVSGENSALTYGAMKFQESEVSLNTFLTWIGLEK